MNHEHERMLSKSSAARANVGAHNYERTARLERESLCMHGPQRAGDTVVAALFEVVEDAGEDEHGDDEEEERREQSGRGVAQRLHLC